MLENSNSGDGHKWTTETRVLYKYTIYKTIKMITVAKQRRRRDVNGPSQVCRVWNIYGQQVMHAGQNSEVIKPIVCLPQVCVWLGVPVYNNRLMTCTK
jgi:hypothetical protein